MSDRDVYTEVSEFVEKGQQNDGDYMFALGVIESTLVRALTQLPKKHRNEILDHLQDIQKKFYTKLKKEVA